ncbi:hypothetical protein [Lentzea sp.]|uniref:hypothetical protein n=1 Tax=Lentzea sp. TaxID=56099 RepID=UPI002ED2E6DD
MTPETAERLGQDLDRLVAEFRAVAHSLVDALPDPDVDLQYARTAGGHEAVVDACPAGFADIARLLDLRLDPAERG